MDSCSGGSGVALPTCGALHSEVAETASYVVGGKGGWTFNLSAWPRGKKFKAGDVLVCNYQRGAHNVVAVNKAGYDGCSTTPRNAKVYSSGKDQIRPVKGTLFAAFLVTVVLE
ncbi:hypothetical protein L1987_78120 [Smallanthus sonchifolius]|uniref:Uncharacterized protein n=1 Tax=Smallanthus sonchifolius TaxID=185202 RepID=A0ACB8ZBH9_9ASTR|nr:hypothetical protein L1987_78120 [Smallanthus sonchifolius]